ncbi:LuxR family transcriptional regulator, maltose regulon positive regulatory protein [Nocardia farcinica]|uniref:Serine/threonine-protein kinase pknK n=1 Tax=Nocardia farcinica TaxID=37329 RepID=A0A0H5NSY3_NOCFR|nr:AAA family ATPase [Nocardia farcinica]AXK86140.1 hypothetical protein DXT66_11365 [Nocardia farcinica]CRY78542.1 Serine/threonine-protein kinase pknK [Nocardia farcinica]SIS92397.1 LuxR family transcriptional regulator, maltose regulon positive regulatory protein [Nocardia farcinica]
MDSARPIPDRPAAPHPEPTGRPLFSPALLARFDRAIAASAAPIILVVGPAGSGKTAFAQGCAEFARPGTRVARLTLTPALNDPTALAAALDTPATAATPREDAVRRAPAQPEHPAATGTPSTDPAAAPHPADARRRRRPAPRNARGENRTRTADTLLVLDDAHHLTDPRALACLARFLHTAAPATTTVLTARHTPPLPWHRWAATGRLTRITAADLRLDAARTAAVFDRHGVALSAAELTAVHRLTGGWPALVHLAAEYVDTHRDYRDAALGMLEHAPRPVADFLAEEVLGGLASRLRAFLAATCLPADFTMELAEELAGDGAASAVEELERRDFPLRRRVREGVVRYSYPPLLRAELVGEVRRSQPDRMPGAHRAACRGADALTHVLSVPGRPELVAFLREHAVRLVLDGAGPILFGRLESARAWVLDDPFLALLHTADALVRGEPVPPPGPPRASRVVDERVLAALAAAVAIEHATGTGTRDTLRALRIARRPEPTGHTPLDYYLELSFGTAHVLRGDTDTGGRGLRRALVLADRMDAARLRVRALARLALAAMLDGDTAVARARARHAVALADAAALIGSVDHLRAVAIDALCPSVPERGGLRGDAALPPPAADPLGLGDPQPAAATAEAPRPAGTGASVLPRSVRSVVAESTR